MPVEVESKVKVVPAVPLMEMFFIPPRFVSAVEEFETSERLFATWR